VTTCCLNESVVMIMIFVNKLLVSVKSIVMCRVKHLQKCVYFTCNYGLTTSVSSTISASVTVR